MKCISLPKHDDQLHALLIEGSSYDSYSIFVPCQLANGKQLRLGVESYEGIGLHIRRQPMLLLHGRAGPELAIANLHIKRIEETQNVNPTMPWLFVDDIACIDMTEDIPEGYVPGKRRGRVVYEYQAPAKRNAYALPMSPRRLRISNQLVAHPELDNLTKEHLDEAEIVMRKMTNDWSDMCADHESERVTIDLPGIDLYLRYVKTKQERGSKLPMLYVDHLRSFAGGLDKPAFRKPVDKYRHELVTLIEMISGMRKLIADGITIQAEGSTPAIRFAKGNIKLNLHVNEWPTDGFFVVVDESQKEFDKKFMTHDTLAQALTSITTRMTYA